MRGAGHTVHGAGYKAHGAGYKVYGMRYKESDKFQPWILSVKSVFICVQIKMGHGSAQMNTDQEENLETQRARRKASFRRTQKIRA